MINFILREIKTEADLLNHISTGNLSHLFINIKELKKLKMSCCKINDVVFFKTELENIDFPDSEKISFQGCQLVNCNFNNTKLKDCNFTTAKLIDCRFENTKLSTCRFRGAAISKSNFKYAQINMVTFEDAKINCCDFYRASFLGVVVFRDCEMENSSLHYTLFADGAIIRRDNLKNDKILQQNNGIYKDFLEDARDKAVNKVGWDVKKSMSERFRDAEDIYRALSALWLSKGYMSDSNWAYVQARRMECEKLKLELKEIPKNERTSTKILIKKIVIFQNELVGFLFGYGESLRKVAFTYLLIFVLFAAAYFISLPDATFKEALALSFYSMLPSSLELSLSYSLTNVLITVQTTMSIILAGILGFVLANKIRCQ
ncbi:putative low-complexity protein [Methanolobus tindarius DSM 2278]|uniref:Putative low-complexity protein n=1 Tax=Methanolobus tindarius DSM 2278 TaxID=1090322 RepID=W9DWK2_METTI|nr:pentapeptide repeat-containing protein [Methanolobus tindarius]ETA67816.1 putative low-complexity protein [Methanolobus tindarius DSM 2278]